MFYYHSDIYRDLNWIETDEIDPVKVIEDFYRKKCYVHDADICGDDTIEFAFEIEGKIEYYKLYYDWYIDYNPVWEIINSHEITKIEKPTYKFPGNRDWLSIKFDAG